MKMKMINANRQKGATLVMAMIILVVLMILGVMAVTTANTQFKLAGNLQFENIAKNNAENQIIVAESWLATPDATPGKTLYINNPGFTTWSAATPQLHPMNDLANRLGIVNGDPLNMTTAQWQANSVNVLGNGYLIEMIGPNKVPPGGNVVTGAPCVNNNINIVNVFRVTARGTNARGAVRYVQTVYQVPRC